MIDRDESSRGSFHGRVLYVARAPFVSGAERALVTMLRHLDRSRVEPALVLGQRTELFDIAQSLNVPVSIVPVVKRSGENLLAWWRSVRRLTKAMRAFQPDVVHANDVPSCQAMSVAAGRLGVPRVVHVRWTIAAGEAGWFARAGAECVICISDWIKAQLGDTAGTPLAKARVEVVHDAVDWAADAVDKPGETCEPCEPCAKPQATTLGFAGQLIESKGLDLVIEAMGRLPADARPRLLVAGQDTQTGGAYLRALQDLAQRRGVADRITWLGFLDDVSQLHRQVWAMVCPSRVEPLGLVPMEAARFNVPTFANNVGGLAETIRHGQTGWLVEPTVEAWTAALATARDGARLEQMGKAAHDHTRRHFSPMVYQQRLMAIYAQCQQSANEPQCLPDPSP